MKKPRRAFILFILMGIGVGCMGPPPTDTPTRVSITDSEGAEEETISLAQGMTHRLYSGVYVADVVGERYIGVADGKDFLSDNEFSVVKNDPTSDPTVIDLKPNGCVVAKKSGIAKVRFSTFSLKAGMLKTIATIQVKDAVVQPIGLKTGVKDFSVSELRDAVGIKYGMALDNKFFLVPETVSQTLADSEGIAIESSGTAKLPTLWADQLRGGFFVGYGKDVSGKDRLSYMMVDSKGTRVPGAFSALTDVDLKRIYGGQLRNSVPVTLALSKLKDKEELGMFGFIGSLTPSQSINAGFLGGIEFPLFPDSELDRSVQFSKDPYGGMHFAAGAFINHPDSTDANKIETVNQLKIIYYGDAGLKIETPAGMTVDRAFAFAFDASGEYPRVIFIQSKNLLFSQRLGGWVLAFRVVDFDVDETFSPRLLSNSEDGTLVALWKNGGILKVKMSLDGGATWSEAMSLVNVAVLDAELIPLPCGGTGLLTVESSGVNLRFIDSTQKQFSAPVSISSTAVKKIKMFRHGRNIRIFYLNQNGGLHLVRIL
ncbi:MAG: hypothetical protein A3G92_05640 [Deltaproteobacteria bacterium RIFCSPLOWO2_12_FULL_38_8]|nr:MAG: hypothetical protein A3A72_04050 [Deltaproteobacteria bacterium RIFCSPLOWO2_01_FULL_38_9]OGQ61494.1 MAG: hypothetical protein A3G92_05640 [Deltaproteobacteria bacterium RIFCSPLOWO2_12_FULL_38_8]